MPFATFLVALLAGMGVGSGGLYVVYLTLFAGKNQLAAQGLNLYFFIFATAAAMLLHVRTAPIRWRRLAVLCAVGAVGCVCGATLTQNMNLTLLRRIFAWVLIASGAVSFLKKEPDAKKIKKTLYK